MTVTLLLCNLKLLFDFFYQSKQLTAYGSPYLHISEAYGHIVNYRSALDRLRVRMNIIVLLLLLLLILLYRTWFITHVRTFTT